MSLRLRGLVGRTLVPLVVGTILVLGGATWVVVEREVKTGREEVLEELRLRSVERTWREQAVFDRITRQLQQARRLLQQRWESGGDGPRAVTQVDGSRRLPPSPNGEPLVQFITASAAGREGSHRAAAVATGLLAEMGPSWCEQLPGMSIAMAEEWLAGWGGEIIDLAGNFLPEDPVVMAPGARDLIAAPTDQVQWSSVEEEPATGHRSVVARIVAPLAGNGTALIEQALGVEEFLRRAGQDDAHGGTTVVLDRQGRPLAASGPGTADPTSDAWRSLLAAVTAIPVAGDPVDLIAGPTGRQWFGVSRVRGPDWRLITVLPEIQVRAQARNSGLAIALVGLAVVVVQVVLIAVLLRRRITRPLAGLALAAGRIAEGERGLELPSEAGDELGELARAFTRMDAAVATGERDLRATAAALREREEFARALIDSAADAVVVIEAGRIIEANPRTAQLFATDRERLRGTCLDAYSTVKQPDGSESKPALAARITAVGKEPSLFPWTFSGPDGTTIEAEIGLARMATEAPQRYVATIRDITERNRLQEQLHHAQRMESIGQLAGGVAHDFNNVLTAIMGSAQLLRDQEVPRAELERTIDDIINAAERAAGLTRGLLEFARRSRPVSTPVDVHRLIRETATLLERSIDRRIAVKVSLEAERSTVVGDSTQLQNALLNLGINARDAMAEGGTLRFATRVTELDVAAAAMLQGQAAEGPHLVVVVSDTGSGIPPEILRRIFEPFFTTKPTGKGTGLGLAGVYRTVCDHHGGLAVSSSVGRGTSFRLYFPLASVEARAQPPATVPLRQRTGTILVIDDDELVRRVGMEMLRALGYTVLEAADGRAGVDCYRANGRDIDVVLVDMEMPGLRGTDCLRELLALDPGVRTVLCSGFASDGADASWAKAGFVGVVGKPYRFGDLATAIDLAMPGHTIGARDP